MTPKEKLDKIRAMQKEQDDIHRKLSNIIPETIRKEIKWGQSRVRHLSQEKRKLILQ